MLNYLESCQILYRIFHCHDNNCFSRRKIINKTPAFIVVSLIVLGFISSFSKEMNVLFQFVGLSKKIMNYKLFFFFVCMLEKKKKLCERVCV